MQLIEILLKKVSEFFAQYLSNEKITEFVKWLVSLFQSAIARMKATLATPTTQE